MAYIILEIDKKVDLGFVQKILTQLKFVKRIVQKKDLVLDDSDEIPETIDESDFCKISKNSFTKAYTENEPEYSLNMLKEPNPDYESR